MFFSKTKKLFKAIKASDLDTVRKLHEEDGVALDVRRATDSDSPLHHAVRTKQTEIARYLLEKGADVDALTYNTNTPLHLAAFDGNDEIIRLLVARGADIDAKECDGWTPVYCAILNKHPETVETLAELGADLNAQTGSGWTALHKAADKGNARIVNFLLQAGADPHVKDNNGHKPIIMARKSNDRDCIELLKTAEPPETGWFRENDKDDMIAHIGTACGREFTEIYNFHAGERITVTRNLKTDAESTFRESFEAVADKTAIAEAAAELVKQGGADHTANIAKNRPNLKIGL